VDLLEGAALEDELELSSVDLAASADAELDSGSVLAGVTANLGSVQGLEVGREPEREPVRRASAAIARLDLDPELDHVAEGEPLGELGLDL